MRFAVDGAFNVARLLRQDHQHGKRYLTEDLLQCLRIRGVVVFAVSRFGHFTHLCLVGTNPKSNRMHDDVLLHRVLSRKHRRSTARRMAVGEDDDRLAGEWPSRGGIRQGDDGRVDAGPGFGGAVEGRGGDTLYRAADQGAVIGQLLVDIGGSVVDIARIVVARIGDEAHVLDLRG